MKIQTILRKSAQWVLRITAGCLILWGIALAAVYLFLQRDPHELTRPWLADLSARTGMEFSIGAIDVSLLPLPSLSISDFDIKGKDLDFNAAWVTVTPSFRELLRGRLGPGSITLLRPKLRAGVDYPVDDPLTIAKNLGRTLGGDAGEAGALKLPPARCEIGIRNGSAIISGGDSTRLTLASLQCDADLDREGLRGAIALGALRTARNGEAIFNVENLRVDGEMSSLEIMESAPDFRASGQIRWKDHIRRCLFDIDFASSSFNWHGTVKLDADLEMGGAVVPASINGSAMKLEGGRQIVFRGLEWTLGADSGSLDATLKLPGPRHPFSLAGTLLLHRASLTEWLGFARVMPPGLQLAMDNIIRARVEFNLTSKGLEASRVEGESTGARFVGKGGVASFSKPVVFLDLRTKAVNLGLVIPESLAITPLAPYFAHAPLTPMGSSPLKAGETGIDYDIRLAADRIKYGPVIINNGSLRIYPGKRDKSGYEDILLSAQGSFYGGSLTGECILGADPSLPCNIVASVRDVNGARLSKAMPELPFRQGTFRGAVNVMSRGKKLAPFLASLHGTMEASGTRATLAATGEKMVFSNLACRAALKSARVEKDRLGMDGQWLAEAAAKGWKGSVDLGGVLSFGDGGMMFANAPGRLKFALTEPAGKIPASSGSLEGSFGCNSRTSQFSVRDGRFDFMGFSGKTSASLNGAKPDWKGDFSLATNEFVKKLGQFGIKPGFSPALDKFSLAASFSGSPDILRLSDIKARLGPSAFSGRLTWETRNGKPFFDFALNADRVDVSSFYDTAREKAGSGKWDFGELRAFNARGVFNATAFRGWDVSLQKLRLPLVLDDGRLTLGPVSARIYGGSLHSRASVNFRQGLAFDCTLAAHDFNLDSAARDRKLKQALTGQANVDASLRARLTGPGQLEKALNGEWSFSARNGSWQGRDKKGALEGRPTKFSLVSASGTIVNGLVKSGNMKLQSADLKLDGKGWLKLPGREMDCDFEVNMRGMPNFPMRVYGSVEKPKTSIGAGKLVINAIGGLTSGVVDILGGIVEGVWKVFR